MNTLPVLHSINIVLHRNKEITEMQYYMNVKYSEVYVSPYVSVSPYLTSISNQ